jgi:hypothetical protein
MKELKNLFFVTLSSILFFPICVYAFDESEFIASMSKLAILGMFISFISFILTLLILRGFFLWYFKININIELLTEIRNLLKNDSSNEQTSSIVKNYKVPSFTLKKEPINDDSRFMPPEMK